MRSLRQLLAVHCGVLLLFAALSSWHTWPLARDMRDHLVAKEDVYMNAWHLWWMRQALWEQPQNPWFSPLLHHPVGAQLYWHTLSPSKTAPGAVLLGVTGAIAAHNLQLFGTFVLAGYTAWVLFRYLLRRAGFVEPLASVASLAGACAFTFSPYHFDQATAHLNLAAIEGVPLYVYFFLRFLDEGRPKYLWGVALTALYVCWSDFYYLLYVALFSLAWVTAERWRRGPLFSLESFRDPFLRRAAAIAVACAVALLPALLPLLLHLKPDPIPLFHGDSDYYVDLLGLLIPDPFSPWLHFMPARWENTIRGLAARSMVGNLEEAGYFLGWGVPLLCMFAVGRGAQDGRRWASIGAMFLILSLGTMLHVGGERRHSPVVLLLGAVLLLLLLKRAGAGGWWKRDATVALLACAAIGLVVPFTAFGARYSAEIPLPYLVFKDVVPLFRHGGMPVRFQFMTTLSMSALVAFAAAFIGGRASARHAAAGLAAAALVALVPILEYRRVPMPMAPVPALPPIFEEIARAPPEVAVATDSVVGQYEQILHRHPITFARQSRIPAGELAFEQTPLMQALHRHSCPDGLPGAAREDLRRFLREHHIRYYVAHWQPCDAWIREVLGGTLAHAGGQRWVYRFEP